MITTAALSLPNGLYKSLRWNDGQLNVSNRTALRGGQFAINAAPVR